MGKNKPRPMTGPKPDPKPLTPEQRAAQGKGKPVGPQLHTDLRRAREEVVRIKREGGTIMSIDIESWEQDHAFVTEIGVSFVKYDPRPGARYPILRQALHYIPLEWRHLVNGRHVPRQSKPHCDADITDNRDYFRFGKSDPAFFEICIGEVKALIDKTSKEETVIMLFHDAQSDVESLACDLGLNVADWQIGFVCDVPPPPGTGRVVIVDTQDLYAAYTGIRPPGGQIGLGRACLDLGIEVMPNSLHNAGNDAAYTLAIGEKMLDPPIPLPTKPVIDLNAYESMNFGAPSPFGDTKDDDEATGWSD